MARISCQNQLILDAWRRYLATSWRFPVRGPFENASGHNLAIARHPGTHFASILPLPNSRERVEDMCAYPTVSVHAAAAEEPGGGRRRRGHAGVAGGRGTAGGTARGARGGISAPSVEHGPCRPQACAAAGRDGGRGRAQSRDGAGADVRGHGTKSPAMACAVTGRTHRRRATPAAGGATAPRGH